MGKLTRMAVQLSNSELADRLRSSGYGMSDVIECARRLEASESILEAADRLAECSLQLLLQPGNRDYEEEMHAALASYATAYGRRL